MGKFLNSGASRWFAFSFVFLFFAILLLGGGFFVFKNLSGLWLALVDISLFLSVLYIFVPAMNKIDLIYDIDLKGKYNYVVFSVNDYKWLGWLIIHLGYIISSFFVPLFVFWLILPLPFIFSSYRLIVENKIVFPNQS